MCLSISQSASPPRLHEADGKDGAQDGTTHRTRSGGRQWAEAVRQPAEGWPKTKTQVKEQRPDAALSQNAHEALPPAWTARRNKGHDPSSPRQHSLLPARRRDCTCDLELAMCVADVLVAPNRDVAFRRSSWEGVRDQEGTSQSASAAARGIAYREHQLKPCATPGTAARHGRTPVPCDGDSVAAGSPPSPRVCTGGADRWSAFCRAPSSTRGGCRLGRRPRISHRRRPARPSRGPLRALCRASSSSAPRAPGRRGGGCTRRREHVGVPRAHARRRRRLPYPPFPRQSRQSLSGFGPATNLRFVG